MRMRRANPFFGPTARRHNDLDAALSLSKNRAMRSKILTFFKETRCCHSSTMRI